MSFSLIKRVLFGETFIYNMFNMKNEEFREIEDIRIYVNECLLGDTKVSYYNKSAIFEAKKEEQDWTVKNIFSNKTTIIKDNEFKKKYELDLKYKSKNIYKSKETPVICIQIKDNISFNTSLGEKNEIKKGGYLVIHNPDNIHGFDEKEFNNTYTKCDRQGNITKTKKESSLDGR